MTQLILEQALNGLQFGLMLFLLAAGLTLVFGIMDMINLAHGSLYMVGAYLTAAVTQASGSFMLGVGAAMLGTAILGVLIEVTLLRRLYARNHLAQVLATFALILIANESVRMIWGAQPVLLNTPDGLSGPVSIGGFFYPAYRLLIIGVGALVAALLYVLVARTRVGMWVRAGASNREMTEALGVNVRLLFTAVLAFGAALCALAGAMLGPLLAVQVGMGESILILAFVVIVIGGIGSIRGALVGSLLVGLVDTLGRAALPSLLRTFLSSEVASSLGPALASMLIYVLMVAVLFWRPEGLFPGTKLIMALYRSSPGRRIAAGIVLVLLVLLPWMLQTLDQGFYVSFASRVLIFALAATSLNLVIGFGGMVSFGHAAFFGAGAYCVAILADSGVLSAALAWPLAIGVAALLALLVGAISLRTRGVYFIMITLAFAQMVFYLVLSLKSWGGDDGLSLLRRSTFGSFDLKDDSTFYFVVLALLTLVLAALDRLAHSRFGRVIQSIRENETRMEALGYPVFSYKLVCFVIGGGLAGLAGALLVNQSGLASPSLLHWMQSGTLMVMIVIGGVGSVFGGVAGAVLLLLCEEFFVEISPHWQIGLGLVLLAVVLWAPLGIAGLFGWGRNRE